MRWRCPCRTCPTCGEKQDFHPSDGDASCSRCYRSWWVCAVPRCFKSRREYEVTRAWERGFLDGQDGRIRSHPVTS